MSEPRNNDQQMENFLAKVGEEWTRESAPAAPADFLAKVKAGVAEARAPVALAQVPEPVGTKNYIRQILAVAAIFLVVALVLWFQESKAPFSASIVYGEKGFSAPSSLAVGSIVDASNGSGAVELERRRVILLLDSGAKLRIEKEDTVYLESGNLWTMVKPGSGFFQVRTADGNVSVHGTEFGVSTADSGTTVMLLTGKVAFEAQGSNVDINAGDIAVALRGQVPMLLGTEFSKPPAWALAMRSSAAAAAAARYYPSGRPAPASQGPP